MNSNNLVEFILRYNDQLPFEDSYEIIEDDINTFLEK